MAFQVDTDLLDEDIQPKFIQLDQDLGTNQFLENCFHKSNHVLWQLWHSVAIPFLKLFMTQTNVNGFLGKYLPSKSSDYV